MAGTMAGPSGAAGMYMSNLGYVYDPATGRWGLPQPQGQSPTFGDPTNFSSANAKQSSDYDTIMQGYKDILSRPSTPYMGTQSTSAALGNLTTLANTGGYSPSDISDLRERAISPIRSIYANAQRNIDRQRALQGGYSPNYTAATAKLARDESSQIDDAVIAANASIAQNIAQNKIAVASPFASAAQADANAREQANQFGTSVKLNATEGMNRLYGTTPALTSMFGNQVAEAARLSQGQQDINMRQGNAAVSMLSPLLAASRSFG